MDISKIKINVPSKHTGEMIAAEVDAMLGAGRIKLCLGHLMQLARMHSPYIYGGQVTELDLAKAMSLWPYDIGKEPDPLKFHEDLLHEIDAAFRPFELFDKSSKKDDGGKHSDVRAFSPEWMADVMRAACQAMPSLGYREILWEAPLTLIMHLCVSEARSNGAVTARPKDIKKALKMMRDRLAAEAAKENTNG